MGVTKDKRKMPVRTLTVPLEGIEDFEGWSFTMRTNPPAGPWLDQIKAIDALRDKIEEYVDDAEVDLTGQTDDAVFERVRAARSAIRHTETEIHRIRVESIAMLLVSWNYVDEEGNDLPATLEGVLKCPSDLIMLTYGFMLNSVGAAPLATSSSSESTS